MKCLLLEIKFEGGLGNQLFQYATGRNLCIQNNIPFLLLNTHSFINQPLNRHYSLFNFKINGSVIKSNTLKKIFRRHTKLNSLARFFGCYQLIEENNSQLQQLAGQTNLLTSLNGYWQSPHYFENIRAVLLRELVPVHLPAFPSWIGKENTVAVHIRRTDYLHEPRYGFIGIDYYVNAIRFIKEKLTNPLFIFFSDDLKWCKQNFSLTNCIFFEENTWQQDHLQLYVMAQCKHQIIANSSFSWWAAWLNKNQDKIVIRPSVPFKDQSLIYQDHYPIKWIAINNQHD